MTDTNTPKLPTTKAEVQTSGSNFPMEIPSMGQSGGLLGGVLAIISTILVVRRRTSKDNLEIAKDRAETNFVKVLQAEREEALKSAAEAWKQRTEDAKAISKLTAEVEYFSREKAAQDRTIKEMQEHHDKVIKEMNERQQRLIKLFSQYAPAEIKNMLADF